MAISAPTILATELYFGISTPLNRSKPPTASAATAGPSMAPVPPLLAAWSTSTPATPTPSPETFCWRSRLIPTNAASRKGRPISPLRSLPQKAIECPHHKHCAKLYRQRTFYELSRQSILHVG